MPLQIEEAISPLPEDFKWGEQWRALRLWKELRDDGEFFYAFVVRMYGPNDYGNKKEDELYIGREIKYIKGKKFQLDHKKPKFGERVDEEADEIVESIFDYEKGKYVEVRTPVNARKTYLYLHKADDKEMAKKYASLIGTTSVGITKMYFVYNYGSRIVEIPNKKDFFEHTVQELANKEQQGNSIFNTESDRAKKGNADMS